MARQKQVDDALARALKREPGAGKIRAAVQHGVVVLLHHEHELLKYRLPTGAGDRGEVLSSWHDKPTDKRVLDAAVAALSDPAFLAAHAGGRKRRREDDAAARPPRLAVETRSLGARGDVNVAAGESVEEKGSIFLAMVAWPVADGAAGGAAVAKLRAETKFAGATHRITGFLAADGASAYDDDGEAKGSASIKAALAGRGGYAVVVARWYGGVNIGPARFRHIKERAALLVAGAAAAAPFAGGGERLGGGAAAAGGPRARLFLEAAERRRAAAAPAATRPASEAAATPAVEPAAPAPARARAPPAPEARRPPPPASPALECPRCTLLNAAGAATCAACEGPLGAPRRREPPPATPDFDFTQDSD